MPDATVAHALEFNIGPVTLTGFGLAVLLAFAIAQVIAQRELLRRGHDANPIPDLILAAVLGTLVGGKLYYITIITHDIRDLWTRAGFVFWGGFMGSVAACYLTIKWKRLNFARISDVAGIGIAAGYAVGRTGCWAVGDDYGRPWSGPLAVAFPDGIPPTTAGNLHALLGVPVPPGMTPTTLVSVHPTQLYETALGFVMFVILWRLRDHKHAEGWLFGLYLVLAGTERFAIEFLRAKDDRFFGPFTVAQLIAAALAGLGLAWMYARKDIGSGRPGIYGTSSAPFPTALSRAT
jgi:phosphatidylglycerol---prolipoprotein diacylglyceryl transferase